MPKLTLNTLSDLLKSRDINSGAYSLAGGLPNECYCIDRDGTDWLVYYSERGLRSGLQRFNTESDACSHLLSVLVSDTTTHSDS